MFVSKIISFFSIRKHQKRVKAMKIMKIPRPSAATTSVMKICGRHMSHVTFGIFPYWRASMGHDEKSATRYGKPFTRIMTCFSVSIQLVSLPSTNTAPHGCVAQGRDARGPKTPGGRMRCRAAALRRWFCAKQNQPWLLRARYIMVLLFFWRSISVS